MRQLTSQNEALYDRTQVAPDRREGFADALARVQDVTEGRYRRWSEILLPYLKPRFPAIAPHLLTHLLELVANSTRSMHWHTLANMTGSGIPAELRTACIARQRNLGPHYVAAIAADMELRQLQEMVIRLPAESADAANDWDVFKASETVYHKAAHFIPGSYHLDPPAFQNLPVWPLDFNRAMLLPWAYDCRLEVLTQFVSLTSPATLLHRQAEQGIHPLRSLVQGLLHLMLEVKMAHDTALIKAELDFREALETPTPHYRHNSLYRHPLLNHLARNFYKLHEYTEAEQESLFKLTGDATTLGAA